MNTIFNPTMKIISVIPARGGSKGIPGKNIKKVAGRPLIGYSIDAALQAEFVDRVIVSTDEQAIANVAEASGAEVILRPALLSGDLASSESALLHVLQRLDEKENYQPDLLVFLQCTSPLTLPEDIDGTVQALIQAEADTSFAAAPFHYYLWSCDLNGKVAEINHKKDSRTMRQQRDGQFIEAGAVYVMSVKGFLKKKSRFFGKTVLYEIPEERCFEIDEPVDLLIAEQMLKGYF